MTRAWTAIRALGVLLVALLVALGPGVGPAATGAATAASTTTAMVEIDHDTCDGSERTLDDNHMLAPRSAPGFPAPRTAGGYPRTGTATVDRPVPADAAGHDDHNRRLAVLQVFRR